MVKHKITVGQQLWCAWNGAQNSYKDALVTITKVECDYAYFGHGRVYLGDLTIDGGVYSSPGRCYLSKEEHDAQVRVKQAWLKLRNFVAWAPTPPGLTEETINAAMALLDRQ